MVMHSIKSLARLVQPRRANGAREFRRRWPRRRRSWLPWESRWLSSLFYFDRSSSGATMTFHRRDFVKLVMAATISLAFPTLASACTKNINGNASAPVAMGSDVRPEFTWPVRGRLVVGCRSISDGIDIAAPLGTVVKAAADGTVAYVGDELRGYGVLIIIRHSNGWVTAYAYNSEALVQRGMQVQRGQPIARVGDVAFFPMLHFEMRGASELRNPMDYLPPR
jgi:murein DD-endopeptidase MepM/ murein hydrolase activator NlpD